jgi:hypothetical protein
VAAIVVNESNEEELYMVRPYLLHYVCLGICIICTFAHLVQEWCHIQTLMAALFYLALWLFAPCLNVLIGVLLKWRILLGAQKVVSLLYVFFYMMYVLSGTTEGMQGAEHMHLVMAPVIFCVIFIVVYLIGLIHLLFLKVFCNPPAKEVVR